MKIDNNHIQQNKEHLNKLAKQQKGEIIAREQEIENIKSLYDQKIENEKVQGLRSLHEIMDRNKAQIIESLDGKQERLEKMKTDLVSTEQKLSEEKKLLTTNHQDKVRDIQGHYNDKYQALYLQGDQNARDINFKTNNSLKEIEDNSHMAMNKIQHDTKIKMDQASHDYNNKVLKAESGHSGQVRRMELEYAKAVAGKELEHQKNLKEINNQNESEKLERSRIQQDQVKANELHHQDTLTSKEKAFQDKYKAMTENHQMVIDGLKKRYDNEIAQLIKTKSTEFQAIDNKKADSFYQVEKLNPKIEETLDSYLIHIPTTEHEKDNFNVSANKRTVKLSMARRFENRLEDNQDVYKTHRSETFMKEFQVKDIVDKSKILSSYNNGVLTFKILKA